ncbi:uncharacterized protein L199_002605 [Kwoniella botswanensis]|uniref:uncharacterized protein n=1 Tax=Kwoniella botswanensis TaxID=1268659 RepID=UPI00315DB7E3
MTTAWSCPNLPSEGTDSICCFANSTCAEYVCGHFGSNITIDTSGGLLMHNCLVSNGTEATELYNNPPANGTCSFNTPGNGCVIRTIANESTTTSGSASASATTSAPAALGSASASASGTSSAGVAQLGGINQMVLLGIVGMTWVIKRVCH